MRDHVTGKSDLAADSGTHPILETRGLTFEVAGRRLLDDVDLRIRPGRATVILGANGAGKSLVLRLLHGLLRPTSGTVYWRAGPLDAAARRAQAMVFQRPVLLRRSVLANLRFALSVRGVAGPERAAKESQALSRAQLADLAARPARVLSGGEQQRLAVARALSTDPQILFLDEPTASLDPASTQAIETLIAEARDAGITIVMITHDAGQARRLADDAIFLADGRVAETGPIGDLLDHPQSTAARAWLDGRLHIAPAN